MAKIRTIQIAGCMRPFVPRTNENTLCQTKPRISIWTLDDCTLQRNQGEKRSAQVLIITSLHPAAQPVLTIWMLLALSHTELPSRWRCVNGLFTATATPHNFPNSALCPQPYYVSHAHRVQGMSTALSCSARLPSRSRAR